MDGKTNEEMIETITYKENTYPKFQSEGFAAKFAFPFAEQVCKGNCGYDIGYCKEEWKFPNAIGIDLAKNDGYHAMNLPEMKVDWIFSSHMLEHIQGSWIETLDYWTSKIKRGGTLFLYLPDYSQRYWRPWENRKHWHIFMPQIIEDYMRESGYIKIFRSQGADPNNSFIIFGEKA